MFCICFGACKTKVRGKYILFFIDFHQSYGPQIISYFIILFTQMNASKIFYAFVLNYYFVVGYDACLQRFY